MQGLEEIAIIHSIDDYQAGLLIKESLKLEGFSYFSYVYNELNDDLNKQLEESDNKFDLIIYVNDTDGMYQKRFKKLAEMNVQVNIESDTTWSENEHQLNVEILKSLWKQILREVYCTEMEDANKTYEIMEKLAEVYCKYDLFRKLLNNTETWFGLVRKKQGENVYIAELQKQEKEWKAALKDLEKCFQTVDDNISGKEHLEYAILYCKRKINNIYDLMGRYLPYDSWEMMEEADAMHSRYKTDFYMAENITSQIAKQSYEYKGMAILTMRNCTQKCMVPACNSFHYYRMAKLYEKVDKIVQAEISYKEAYELNQLNFRAGYKCGVFALNKKEFETAKWHFRRVLQILQITIGDSKEFEKSIRKLPALELEYVCKCFVLLAEIERLETTVMDEEFYSHCLKRQKNVIAIIEKNQNNFINMMYSDAQQYKIYLVEKLSLSAIREKIKLQEM
mgnify:CR=1 FL=1|jgi:hypothetical protein